MPSKKKNWSEGDIGTYRREGGRKNPLFIKKGTYLYGGRGQNLFVTYPMFTFVFLFPNNLEYFLRPYSMKIVNLSLLLEGRGGKWTIFYVTISLVPFRLGRGGGANENVPMSPSGQFFFGRHPLLDLIGFDNWHLFCDLLIILLLIKFNWNWLAFMIHPNHGFVNYQTTFSWL